MSKGILKKLNALYNGGSPNLPLRTDDVYWAQDKIRDNRYLQELPAFLVASLFQSFPCLISGGIVTQGAGATLNITEALGIHYSTMTIPDTFASLPPSATTASAYQYCLLPVQTNFAAPYVDATPYYVKMYYTEANGNTRARLKGTGTYSYEVTDSVTLYIDTVAPTTSEILLATYTSATSVFTITSQSQPTPFLYKSSRSYVTTQDANYTLPGVLPIDSEFYFVPTADRTFSTSTYGATNPGTLLHIHNASVGSYRVTITATGAPTMVLSRGMWITYKWDGVNWRIWNSSLIGKSYDGIDTTVPPNVLLNQGGLKSRTAFADFWQFVQNNFTVVTDAAWLGGQCGGFSSGDLSTTFRMPDWSGLFARISGTNSVLKHGDATTFFAGGALTSVKIDQLFPHRHGALSPVPLYFGSTGGTSANLTAGGAQGSSFLTTGDATTDGTHGMNSGDGETAPARISVNRGFYVY